MPFHWASVQIMMQKQAPFHSIILHSFTCVCTCDSDRHIMNVAECWIYLTSHFMNFERSMETMFWLIRIGLCRLLPFIPASITQRIATLWIYSSTQWWYYYIGCRKSLWKWKRLIKDLKELYIVFTCSPSVVCIRVTMRQWTLKSSSKSWITCSKSFGISKADRASWQALSRMETEKTH